MTIEVLPLGTQCALACEMCYQQPIRDAGNQATADYDLDAMKRALGRENYAFTLFGGEGLLMPIDDLEELWRWGYEKFGRNSVQTSATTVTDKHFELFKTYNVSVGVSLEGPGELNDIRWAGSLERTREASARALDVVHRLLDEGSSPSIITTLNSGNVRGRISRLLSWFLDLDQRGLRHVNLHLLESETEAVRKKWALTDDENAAALLACADLQADLQNIRFQPITDMVSLLNGKDEGTNCVWNACDPYTTRAVHGVNGAGDLINCSRTNKDGVDHRKASAELLVRPLALWNTPQDDGGCHGCRFWYACKGQCPGTAVGGDWRRRTEHCGVLQMVFEELERRIRTLGGFPLSADEPRRAATERRLLEAYAAGRLLSVSAAARGDDAAPSTPGGTPDREHGDTPHGDHDDAANPVVTHGDHNDAP